MMRIVPYGAWESPITSELIVAGTVRLLDVAIDGQDIYWVESRPTEGGRYVVVRRSPDGTTTDVSSLDGELYFLSRVFGFEPAEPIEPVPIGNL